MRNRMIVISVVMLYLTISGTLPSMASNNWFPNLSNSLPSSFPVSPINCQVEQPASNGVAAFESGTTDFLGKRLALEVPIGWGCTIEDAYGSGGGISFEPGTSGYYFDTGRISLFQSANAQDSGLNFCQVSSVVNASFQKCSPSLSSIPSTFKIIYLYGSSTSHGLIAMVESPYALIYGGAKLPTITLIAGGRQVPSIALSCQIGHSFSQMCYSDELGLARFLLNSNYPKYWNS